MNTSTRPYSLYDDGHHVMCTQALVVHQVQPAPVANSLQEEWEARVAGRDRTAAAVQEEWEARVAAKEASGVSSPSLP